MHGYLTFDVGTTAVKSCLFDDDLRLLSIANEEYTLDTDAGGWVELDPERYWQAVCGGAAEALRRAQLPPEQHLTGERGFRPKIPFQQAGGERLHRHPEVLRRTVGEVPL